MAKAAQPANSTAHANASVRREPKTDEGHVNDQRCQTSPKIAFENEEKELKTRKAKPLAARAAASACLKLRMESGGHWMLRKQQLWAVSGINHRRLDRLLDRLAAGHQWREASAVLSTLFASYPSYYSPSEDRKNFMIAMELQKRFCWNRSYHNLIKSTYEIWFGKLSMKGNEKIHLLQLELTLFYLTQGKFTEAHSHTRFLLTEEFGCEPFINLIHGLILYQLWYADLPEEMQIKGFDAQTSSDAFGLTLIDGFQETEIGESSNGHDAVDIENSKASFQCSSESSVGNEKVFMVGKYDVPRKNSVDAFNAQGHISQCDESQCDEEERGLPINQDNFVNTSIYFASGLDKRLLPIQLKLLTEDPIQSILLYRKLANEKYRDAVKHLRRALHSTPPLLAALLPLIQLLLLGDQVREAFVELDKACHELDSALPFRLKARLLQCFCSSEISTISSCYESALTRDPSCNYSIERLIKMHKTGDYNVTPLVETLAKHLDAVDGKCSIWEEFASCFLELQTAMLFHSEDCISANMGVVTDNVYCNRIPTMFTEGETGDTWRLRCRWWVSRHFGRSISLSEIQAGEWMLLQFKAACAIHLYGPNFEYVTAVINSFTQQGNASQLSYLNIHIKNPMNLRDILAEL
ncbi:uncharacterized protein LOC110095089 isoform X2 [Dendrobium catenatum]|uniref:uncharacterized protein LOC110095089 isoform X2 n=1 Tax=Dendrobium catenatum TaxID=906689 RepID=UPI0009F41D8D|nr:uncharacterized protein LOC110095089 isoform X2 [Dendrobium catenatum]